MLNANHSPANHYERL